MTPLERFKKYLKRYPYVIFILKAQQTILVYKKTNDYNVYVMLEIHAPPSWPRWIDLPLKLF